MRHSCSLNLWLLGLLLAAGFGLPRVRANVSSTQVTDSLPPLVDRLPTWYFEQKPNQAVGVSFAGMDVEAAFQQAVLMARIWAALQHPSSETIKGEFLTFGNGESLQVILKLPKNYKVLNRCRLEGGTVLALIQYGVEEPDEMEEKQLYFNYSVYRDTIASEVFMSYNEIQDANNKVRFYTFDILDCRGKYLENGCQWRFSYEKANKDERDMDSQCMIDYTTYYTLSRNPNLLVYPDVQTEKYLGWLCIDGLHVNLCKRIISMMLKEQERTESLSEH